MKKHNPDDRRNNVDRIQNNIDHTIQNIEIGEEVIEKTDDRKTRKNLERKNERRQDALTGMRNEIKDEAMDKEHDYTE
ncbi:MAG: small acid-soluble spore protein Tlp [Bacillota bacterium]|nr:small acid-soluble spore protein Tlp [Bacillota bacterium]